jgi:putative transposase
VPGVPPGTSVSCRELRVLLQDQGRGWDPLEVLLPIVCRLVGCLSGVLAVLVQSDLSKNAELLVLGQENQVLRRG